MLRRLQTMAISGLIFIGLGLAWMIVILLVATLLNVRALHRVMPEDIYIWGGTAVLFLVWMIPLSYAHKRVMKRLGLHDRDGSSS